MPPFIDPEAIKAGTGLPQLGRQVFRIDGCEFTGSDELPLVADGAEGVVIAAPAINKGCALAT